MAAAAWSSPLGAPSATSVDVDFGYRGVISDGALRVDDKCYVTLEFLRKVDWDPEIQGNEVRIHDDGRTFNLPLFSIAGKRLICLNDAAKEMQAAAYYPQNSETFYFKSAVLEAGATAKGLTIKTSNRVRPMVTLQGERLTVDLKGANYDPTVANSLPPGWKMAYTNLDTVRIIIEHPSLRTFSTPKLAESRSLTITLPDAVVVSAQRATRYADPTPSRSGGPERKDFLPGTTNETPQRTPMPPLGNPQPQVDNTLPAPTFGTVAGDVTITNDDSERLSLNVFVQNMTPGNVSATYNGANQIVVTFKGAQWKRAGEVGMGTKLARTITRTVVDGSAALSIFTERPVVFNLSTMADSVGIRLTRPFQSGGLSRKVVVVDAGHGGHDNGANYGSLYEKDMTLKYAQAVAARLQREGVSVIMTRNDDSYPTLTRRWQLANESNADAFISIHINSLDSNAPQACMTFYHGTSGISQLLAECLQTELSASCSIPSWGTVSDFKRFREGMAVLRTNRSPSVLMELGFINNSRDRAEMLAPDYPDRLAEAITRGLKKFFGGR
jgi:N-acetylmuramoyl-L-alanine amidase